jgi:hypothetical protein
MKNLQNKRVHCVMCVKIANATHTIKIKLYSIYDKVKQVSKKIQAVNRVPCSEHACERQTRLFPYLLYVELFSAPSNFFPYIREKEKSVFKRVACLDAFLRKIPAFGKIEVAHA